MPGSEIAILGIPALNGSVEDVVDAIKIQIAEYKKDLQPRYVATINVDFLSNIYTWSMYESFFPELLFILRQSNVISLDGMPIVWLCRLLGSDVRNRVTGVDLVPRLVEALGEDKQSIFLLGSDEQTLKLCILYFQSISKDVRIAGALHPMINVQGELLEIADERDWVLIEQINKAEPDILLLSLGNPKQEIWFERVRTKLQVPVTIGIGGTFDLLAGVKTRAPKWMQDSGLEWLFRLKQEPRRLFKRYFTDLLKFPWLALPLVCYHSLNRLVFRVRNPNKKESVTFRKPLLFISSHHTIVVVRLPKRLNALISHEIDQHLEDLFSQDTLILDFSDVQHIDLEGLAQIIKIWQKAEKEKKELYAIGITPDVRLLLKLHRIWDIIDPHLCLNAEEVMARLNPNSTHSSFYDSIQQNRNTVIINFFGRLDNKIDYDSYLKKISPIIYQKNCILDFTYCTYIDNSGFTFLLKLKKNLPRHFNSLKLCCLNSSLVQQFKNANTYEIFEVMPNLNFHY